LNNKKIINLDIGLMIAGTNFRGEFEARLKQVVKEATANKNIILFVDEIHTLVGAGNAIGGMDAANLLKPALSRGDLQIIGATTTEEYRKSIEKDAALERRFQTIFVNEPTIQETEKILTGIKSLYEKYHNIVELYCYNEELYHLPTILPKSLRKLDCNNNCIVTLPELPDSLEVLNCSVNKIKCLPIKLPSNLKILNCSRNYLVMLPKDLPETIMEIDCSKYYHAHMKHKIVTYKLTLD